ncbi:pimeloyl-CoA dehydrogenase large subunit [Diaphorobacter sp. HDW4A]|uniref:acyl-CoA dehydrogenase family protein n=1 Tax=Diaphorobacter sp. HDW4A TaxID=2714924 RepID=UPI00140AC6A2|nr:acyl-CoA dehydrogenase family protein [Diaphorobacter sp. HDW4A]QIL80006.1 pimeloyl-CoA dehydrogenase large subunit [Diaphorobacter sp. HDW4A]
MDLNYTEEEHAFRLQVRAFLQAQLPQDIRRRVTEHKRMRKQDHTRWHKILARQGWVAPGWPVEHGGTGWSPVQTHIFEEECDQAGAPRVIALGVKMIGPVLIAFGNEEQKRRHLARIYSGDEWWCQGYSEPGAGSDLASLATRAELDGDAFIVNGQKTWTTLGHYADMMFCLVRTDPHAKKQEGISFLLIDMKSSGITVRPIVTIEGEHHVNEVFFDNVRVPVSNLVGELNKGWTYAKHLLGHERFSIAQVGKSKRELVTLKRMAREQMSDGRPMIEDPLFAEKMARVEIELMALEFTNLRLISAAQSGQKMGAEPSILKIKGCEVVQSITELMVEVAGPHGLAWNPRFRDLDGTREVAGAAWSGPLASEYLDARKISIFGGTDEIQKNILAKLSLGL